MVFLLGVQSLLLLEEDENCTCQEGNSEDNQASHKAQEAIHDDEAKDGCSDGDSCPCDIASLYAHEFKRLLESLEHGVADVLAVFCLFCHVVHLNLICFALSLESEEQRKGLCSCNQEDASTDDHHDLLLENLLPNCNALNINTPRKRKVPKETNWKQKFQKPQNENICLTCLNMENKRNFHFLSFRRDYHFIKRCKIIVANFDLNLQYTPIIWEVLQKKRQ